MYPRAYGESPTERRSGTSSTQRLDTQLKSEVREMRKRFEGIAQYRGSSSRISNGVQREITEDERKTIHFEPDNVARALKLLDGDEDICRGGHHGRSILLSPWLLIG